MMLCPLRVMTAFLLSLLCLPAKGRAESVKEACVEAHGRGQEAREQGKLSLARKVFMTCAQTACPELVQNDCARYADEIERYQPSIALAARDAEGNDLPDTTVYLDGELVATRLGDGRPHEVDPGAHVLLFEHGGQKQTLTIVAGVGEKGRTVVATFASHSQSEDRRNARPGAPATTHALGARVLVLGGAALLVGGTVVGVVGLTRVPDNCSASSHECKSPPADPSLDEASSAVRLSNIGWVGAGVGTLALGVGIVWYLRSEKPEGQTSVTPVLAPGTAGIMVRGRL